MSQWQLKDCYILEDMDRLDKAEYFQIDFACPELTDFFSKIKNQSEIQVNRKNINEFFDKLLSLKSIEKNLYVRLKWLVYFHSQLQSFRENPLMYEYVAKALHLYFDRLPAIEKKLGPYENYLIGILFKPYLQYLIKICMLNNEEDKQNQNTSNASKQKQEWYRIYNFVHWAREHFNGQLSQTKEFFAKQFPYLNKIGIQIYQDLKKFVAMLKKQYPNSKLEISLMELDQLEQKITLFYQDQLLFMTKDYAFLGSEIKDYSMEEVTNFFTTPTKVMRHTLDSIHVYSPYQIS